jgi:tetratricopeptide (TPR) repeat protein
MNTFKKALDLGENSVESYVLTNYFKTVLKEVAAGKFDKSVAVDVYNQLNQIADFNIANSKDSTGKEAEKFAQAKQVLDADLAGNLVKDCQDIIQNFGLRYEANPGDKKLRDLVYSLLINKSCTQEPIFLKVAESRLDDTGEERLALLLARIYKQKEQIEKALDNYQKAVNAAQNDSTKAQYCYEMAAIYSNQEQLTKARQMAQEAIKFRSDWGKPYIFIGDLYASSAGRCGEGIASQSVYWAAVDKYKKAREVDLSCTDEATQRINKYTGYFPDKEALFFQSIDPGRGYSVGCWINEGTIVRSRN